MSRARAIFELEEPDTAWRPIEEAPKDGTQILVAAANDIATAEFTDGGWVVSPVMFDGDGWLLNLGFRPTHWMPLPEPPK